MFVHSFKSLSFLIACTAASSVPLELRHVDSPNCIRRTITVTTTVASNADITRIYTAPAAANNYDHSKAITTPVAASHSYGHGHGYEELDTRPYQTVTMTSHPPEAASKKVGHGIGHEWSAPTLSPVRPSVYYNDDYDSNSDSNASPSKAHYSGLKSGYSSFGTAPKISATSMLSYDDQDDDEYSAVHTRTSPYLRASYTFGNYYTTSILMSTTTRTTTYVYTAIGSSPALSRTFMSSSSSSESSSSAVSSSTFSQPISPMTTSSIEMTSSATATFSDSSASYSFTSSVISSFITSTASDSSISTFSVIGSTSSSIASDSSSSSISDSNSSTLSTTSESSTSTSSFSSSSIASNSGSSTIFAISEASSSTASDSSSSATFTASGFSSSSISTASDSTSSISSNPSDSSLSNASTSSDVSSSTISSSDLSSITSSATATSSDSSSTISSSTESSSPSPSTCFHTFSLQFLGAGANTLYDSTNCFVGSPNANGEYYCDGVHDANRASTITLGSQGWLYATPSVGSQAGTPLIANINAAANPAVIFWTPLWQINSFGRTPLTCTLDTTTPAIACQAGALTSFSYFGTRMLSIKSGTGVVTWIPKNLGCATTEPISPNTQPASPAPVVGDSCDYETFKVRFSGSSVDQQYAVARSVVYAPSADIFPWSNLMSFTTSASSAPTFTIDPAGRLWLGGFLAVLNTVDSAPSIFFMSEADMALSNTQPLKCSLNDINVLSCQGGSNTQQVLFQVGTDPRFSTAGVMLGSNLAVSNTIVSLIASGRACSSVAPVPY